MPARRPVEDVRVEIHLARPFNRFALRIHSDLLEDLPVVMDRSEHATACAQAELGYRRMVADWRQQLPKNEGAGATGERASRGPSSGQAARQGSAPEPALSSSSGPAPKENSRKLEVTGQLAVDFHPSVMTASTPTPWRR